MPDPAWKQKLDRLTNEADRRRKEQPPVDYKTALATFEAAVRDTKKLWGSTGADEWPVPQKKDLAKMVNNAQQLARKKANPWLALTMVGLVDEELKARGKLQKETALALKDAFLNLQELSSQVEALVPKAGPEPEGISKLRDPLATALLRQAAAKKDFGAGIWNRAHSEAVHSRTVCKQVRSKLAMWDWRGAMTLDLQQGGYTMQGMDESLLSQVESQGVCKALALDWLGGGDLKGDGVQDGRVAMKHRFWQAGYQLDFKGDSDKELRDKALTLARVLGKTEGTAKIEATLKSTRASLLLAEFQLKEKTAKSQPFRDKLTQWSEEYARCKVEIGRIKEVRSEMSEPTWKQQEHDQLVIERDLALKVLKANRKTLALMNELADEQAGKVKKMKLDVERLEQALADEEEKILATIPDHYAAMQKMTAKHRELQRQWQLAAPGTGVRVPSLMMEDMGLELVSEGSISTRPLGGSKFLTEDQIKEALAVVANVEPGGESHYQVGVQGPPGGHAMALKVKRSAAPEKKLTLEFFDPNHGAFALDDLGLLQRLVLDIWASWGKQWNDFTTMQVKPTGKGSPEVIDMGEPEDRFVADMVVLEDGLRRVLIHPGVPPKLRPEFQDRIAKIKKLRPSKRDDEFGHLEFKRAQVHIQETREHMEKLLLNGDEWLDYKRRCVGLDPVGNPAHVLVANAVKLAQLSWLNGNLERAVFQIKGAANLMRAPLEFEPVDLDMEDEIQEGPM